MSYDDSDPGEWPNALRLINEGLNQVSTGPSACERWPTRDT
jgi:hypothetical protein